VASCCQSREEHGGRPAVEAAGGLTIQGHADLSPPVLVPERLRVLPRFKEDLK
jgi:hypothetical protein